MNPWGLVYDNAIAENIVNTLQLHPVTYDVDDITVSANVYLPAGYGKAGHHAAVVVSHPNGGVKEQASGMFS